MTNRPNRSERPNWIGPDWFADAACAAASIDPDEFFPVYGPIANNAIPRRICHGCPVIDRCREYAWNNGERHGIWGGMTPQERVQWATGKGLPRPTLEPEEPGEAKTPGRREKVLLK